MALTEIKQSGLDDEAVNEAKVQISNAGSNGQYLQKQSGNTGGLTWATVAGAPEGTAVLSTGESGGAKFLREDGDGTSSWQTVSAGAGGSTGLDLDDSVRLRLGSDQDFDVRHSGTSCYIENDTGPVYMYSDEYQLKKNGGGNSNTFIKMEAGSGVKLFHDDAPWEVARTVSGGFTIAGTCTASTFSGSGASLTNLPSANILSFGTNNTKGGTGSLAATTSASQCTAFGKDSLNDVTSGHRHTAFGFDALSKMTTNSDSTAFGNDALKLATASCNTAVGCYALSSLTDGGDDNTACGYEALRNNTSGSNTAIGHGTLKANTSGNTSTAVGSKALKANTTADSNTAVGSKAMESNTTGPFNTSVGWEALKANTTGARNTAVGAEALDANTTGNHNVAIGYRALTSNTTSSYNTCMGRQAGNANTTGNIVAIGYHTGYTNTTGAQNTFVGMYAGYANTTGSDNTVMGRDAGANITTGGQNTVIGKGAGNNMTVGNRNVCIGMDADCGNEHYNVSVGPWAGEAQTTCRDNTCIGNSAGMSVTSGDNNLMLGKHSGRSDSPSGAIATTDNIVCLGDNNIANLYCADTSISSSDKRDKTDVVNFTQGLNWVNQLNPITYRWDKRSWYDDNTPDGSKKQAKKHIGFLAQDVLTIEGNPSSKNDMLVVNLNEDDTAYGLKYERLVPVLVNAIKELSAKVTALENA